VDYYNQILLGDCRDLLQRLVLDGEVDLTVTSPPWDDIFDYGNIIPWNWKVFTEVAKLLWRVTKEGGVVCRDVADSVVKGCATGSSERQACYFMELGFTKYEELIVNKHRQYPGKKRHVLPPEKIYVFSKGFPAFAQRRRKRNKNVGKAGTRVHRKRDGSTLTADCVVGE